MTYELECRYDSRKSFYGKAIVETKEDNISYNALLYSYGTLVAIYTRDKFSDLAQFTYCGKYSQTTSRHQREFFKQHSLSNEEIRKLENVGFLEKEMRM